MPDIQRIVDLIDDALDTKSKRHIVGGVLLSVSLLFGGLAITTLTIRKE
jgi:hypothetical protein